MNRRGFFGWLSLILADADEIRRLRSSMAEQQFCKLPVAGSSPAAGFLADEEREAILAAADSKPEPCITPAYAGFDGSFRLYGGTYGSGYLIKLARTSASSPGRWKIDKGRMGYWRNDDGTVSKLIWRNADGKLFDLQFVPMEEPT